jgi:hypothetical protein
MNDLKFTTAGDYMNTNERIKQLAEQAEKYADDNFKGQPTYSEAYDSKFAELIVKECVDTAFHRGHPDLEFLLKHFGVEK